jgi:hypothetical protein
VYLNEISAGHVDTFPSVFLGPLVEGKELLREVREINWKDKGEAAFTLVLLLAMLFFFPACIYFASSFFLRELPWGFVLSFWMVVGTMLFFLWRTGMRRDRAARNPLLGLLDPQPREDLKA